MEDLDGRGQTHERKAQVLGALSELSLSVKYEAAMAAAEADPPKMEGDSPMAEALQEDLDRVDSVRSEDLAAELEAARAELARLKAAEMKAAGVAAPPVVVRRVSTSS